MYAPVTLYSVELGNHLKFGSSALIFFHSPAVERLMCIRWVIARRMAVYIYLVEGAFINLRWRVDVYIYKNVKHTVALLLYL